MAFYRSKVFWALAAALVGVLAIYGVIHMSPGKYFERGDLYVTYFDESVQGLQEYNRVHFRGVDVGSIRGIKLSPDQKVVEVTLKLKLKQEVVKETVAQLKVNPISGQVYLELDMRKPDEKVRTFALTFTPKYPVIPSRFSDIQKAMAGINMLVEKIDEAGGKGIFDQVRSTVKVVEVFFRGPRMESILEKVDGTMGNLKSITGRADKILASGRVEEILTEARNTLRETQTTMARAQVLMAQVDEAVGRTATLTTEIKATNENLFNATKTLNTLVNRINERPADLLFGKPSPGRFNE
jgi:phospholipid/cholesterol/gamma-HCH transport system substrate-binding protein